MLEPQVEDALRRADLPLAGPISLFHATNAEAAEEITDRGVMKGDSNGQVWLASSKEIAALMYPGGVTSVADGRNSEIDTLLEVEVDAKRLYWGEARPADQGDLELFFLLDEGSGCEVAICVVEPWIPPAPEFHTEPWIYWLQAAKQQTEATRRWRETSEQDLPIGEKLVQAVLEELPNAMQAISAAAFAVDSFEGAVADMLPMPKASGPRSKRIIERLASAAKLKNDVVEEFEPELRWLFETRNKSVHGAIWKDPAFRHPSGVSISAAQREFCLESAEWALAICQRFIAACLEGAKANQELADWAAMRLARCEDLLER